MEKNYSVHFGQYMSIFKLLGSMFTGEVSECTEIERENDGKKINQILNCPSEDAKFQKFSGANLTFIVIIAG